MPDNNTIERLVPDSVEVNERTGLASLKLHLERYHFAGKHIRRGVMADMACGTGYGSFLLASDYGERATTILAIDNDAETINYANARYAHPSIRFLQTDITQFVPPCKLQNVVCLETLEHLTDPETFIRHIAGYLEKESIFIASVPITPSMDANPFHLHDFTKTSFRRMFTKLGFEEIASMQQVQPYGVMDILSKKEKRTENTRNGLLHYYFQHPAKLFLRIRSVLNDGLSNKYLTGVFKKM